MMRSTSIALLIFFMLFFPLSSRAWNTFAHQLIANIAYQKLNTVAKEAVDTLIIDFTHDYPKYSSFISMAYWPDSLHGQKIEAYSRWHYIDVAFSDDGTPVKNLIDTDNAYWAVGMIEPILQNASVNPYDRARFLAFFIHIVADLHQPLHTVSRISSLHPDGDRGGNLFFVRYNNKRIPLHQLWDRGVGAFDIENSDENIAKTSKRIMAQYPENYFGDRVNDLHSSDWIKDGMDEAYHWVYVIPQESVPDEKYIGKGQQISEQAAALAGYR